jgi:hypothetical protein
MARSSSVSIVFRVSIRGGASTGICEESIAGVFMPRRIAGLLARTISLHARLR